MRSIQPLPDTNTEYIQPAVAGTEPPVLKSVAHAIVVETLKGFFRSVIGFFLRYIRHFIRCLVYFISPSLRKKPFSELDFKENSQHAFEFIIIVLAALIFMIKAGWVPESNAELVELYNNDLAQRGIELLFFAAFALVYLLLAGISIVFGRFLRMVFNIRISVHESDILQVYLNNAVFSLAAITVFILRCFISTEVYEAESIGAFVALLSLPIAAVPCLVWSVCYPVLQKLVWWKAILFVPLSLVLFGLFYWFGVAMVTVLSIWI